MSDYVEGEDCWKKVKHTNLSDAQADIAALQMKVIKLSCPICRASDKYHKMDCQNRAYVAALQARIDELTEALQRIDSLNDHNFRLSDAMDIAKAALEGKP